MLGPDGKPIDAKTRRRAEKAKEKIDKMIREWTAWKGERPTVIRVRMSDYLVLREVNWCQSWPGVEIKGAP